MKKTEILQALQILQKGTTNKELIPQANHLILENDFLRTYNGDMSVQIPFETGITGAVPFDLFYKFIDKFNKEEFDISLEENKIWLSSKKQRAWFLIQSEIKLPNIFASVDFDWKPLPENFWDTCSLAADVCSTDVSEIALTCIQVNNSGVLYGTDKKRILKASLIETIEDSFLLSADDCRKISTMQPQQYCLTDNWIHFLMEDEGIISSRRILADYPALASFFNTGKDSEHLVFPDKVTDALERLSLFSKTDIDSDASLDVEFSKKKLKLSSSTEIGGYEETLPLKANNLEISFSIIPYLLQHIVKKNLGFIIEDQKIFFSGENWEYVSVLKAKQ